MMNKTNNQNKAVKHKSFSLISSAFILGVTVCCAYYLLLQDNALHTSIASIIARTNHLGIKPHLFVLGLLPIYIATILFGAAIFGLYLGSRLESLFIRPSKSKINSHRKITG